MIFILDVTTSILNIKSIVKMIVVVKTQWVYEAKNTYSVHCPHMFSSRSLW